MKKVLVIAPHPDDETLGCGGTLLKHKNTGDQICWLTITSILEAHGFPHHQVVEREQEIKQVAKLYGFNKVYNLDFPTTKLDNIPIGDIIFRIGEVIKSYCPEVIYIPFSGDVHTDHKVVTNAAISCTKWFRYPFVHKILCYETLSETEFGIDPSVAAFRPNVFVDISDYFEQKLTIMNAYKSELRDFPFPRSEKAIRALGLLRGAAIGKNYGEAFMLLKEIL